MRKRKIKTFDERMRQNNMLYRKGEKVKVRSKEELRASGSSKREARKIKHLCGRILTIERVDEKSNAYYFKEIRMPLFDSNIKNMVL